MTPRAKWDSNRFSKNLLDIFLLIVPVEIIVHIGITLTITINTDMHIVIVKLNWTTSVTEEVVD